MVLVINNMLHMVLCWNSILGKDPTAWCRCKRCWFRCYRNISRLSDEEIVSDHTTNSQQHQLMGNKIPLVFHMNTHVLSLSLSLSLFLSLSPPLPLPPPSLSLSISLQLQGEWQIAGSYSDKLFMYMESRWSKVTYLSKINYYITQPNTIAWQWLVMTPVI